MNKFKYIIFGILAIVATYITAGLIHDQNAYSFEEMMGIISTCGTFIQAGFRNPERGQSDYFIVLVSFMVVVGTLFYSIKFLIRPNENRSSHIKFQILEKHEDKEESKNFS